MNFCLVLSSSRPSISKTCFEDQKCDAMSGFSRLWFRTKDSLKLMLVNIGEEVMLTNLWHNLGVDPRSETLYETSDT